MFRGWGFLLGEIWVLIALAALLGLFIGWLIWARRKVVIAGDDGTAARLQAELDACRSRGREAAARIAALEAELAALTPVSAPEPVAVEETAEVVVPDEAMPEAASLMEEPADTAPADIGVKPATLDAPLEGAPDDLKRIKGIGPKLEALCNRLGFWHFDQIAAWTEDEIAWVDANLETFKGRVTRDDWVAQAKVLAAEKRGE